MDNSGGTNQTQTQTEKQNQPKTNPQDLSTTNPTKTQTQTQISELESLAHELNNQTHTSKPAKLKTLNTAKLPKHLDRAIITAETYHQRDLLCRRLSAYCFNMSKTFMNKQEYTEARKWMELSQTYLHLSFDPKKAHREEQIDEDLNELENLLNEARKSKKQQEEKEQQEQKTQPHTT